MDNKILISFKDNEIKLKNFKKKDIYFKKIWDSINDKTSDLVSNIYDKKILNKTVVKHFQWEGMSTWWLNKLTSRGTEIENRWVKRIFITLLLNSIKGKKTIQTDDEILIDCIKKNKQIKNLEIYNSSNYFKKKIYFFKNIFLFLRSFLRSIYKVFFLKFFYPKNDILYNKSNTWFFTIYPANWTNKSLDRQLLDLPNKDNSYYLFYYLNYPKDIHVNKKIHLKKFKEIQKKIKDRYVFVESYLNFFDIVKCYYSSIAQLIKLHKLKYSKEFTKNFSFKNNLDLSDVFFDELSSSYYELIPYAKLNGISVKNFFKNFKKKQTYVSYAEMFSEHRAAYYFLKKGKIKHTTIALQHAILTKNYSSCNLRKKEFYNKKFNSDLLCPSPDYYFTSNYAHDRNLSKFLPKNKLHNIGLIRNEKIKKKIISLKPKNKFIILIPFSQYDFKFFINELEKLELKKKYLIIFTLHPNMKYLKTYQIMKNRKLKFNYKILKNINTNSIIDYANLIICGYSTIAINAGLKKKEVLILRKINEYPVHNFNQYEKKIFSEISSFDNLSEIIEKKKYKTNTTQVKKIFSSKFNSHKNFWKTIKKINENSKNY